MGGQNKELSPKAKAAPSTVIRGLRYQDAAKAAGAAIVMAPEDQPCGGRLYARRDLEGHPWNFGTYDPWE